MPEHASQKLKARAGCGTLERHPLGGLVDAKTNHHSGGGATALLLVGGIWLYRTMTPVH
jgi:hypothetical protein